MKTILFIVLATFIVSVIINFVLAYTNLRKNSTVADYFKSLRTYPWFLWIPVVGLVLQIVAFCCLAIDKAIDSIKSMKIK